MVIPLIYRTPPPLPSPPSEFFPDEGGGGGGGGGVGVGLGREGVVGREEGGGGGSLQLLNCL